MPEAGAGGLPGLEQVGVVEPLQFVGVGDVGHRRGAAGLGQVAAVALFWNALRHRSRVSADFGGVLAGVALFFSYEIGAYSIAGALAGLAVVAAIAFWLQRPPATGGEFFTVDESTPASAFLVNTGQPPTEIQSWPSPPEI